MKQAKFIILLLLLSVVDFGPHEASGQPSKHRESIKFYKRTALYPMEGTSGISDLPDQLKDAMHGVKMGLPSDVCDNAVDKLDVDWNGSPENYTCYHPKDPLPILEWVKPVDECYLPKGYFPKHVCMTEKIHYEDSIPTYGSHRPLWPIYGEYIFLPPQRWLHNLEHGAIVMLYHPCAEPLEVERLRIVLKSCLRRYIITPSKSLPIKRPLALISWGCKLLMNHVDKDTVTQFIKAHALHAPEGQLPKQGQYKYKLLEKSSVVPGSTFQDSKLCPHI